LQGQVTQAKCIAAMAA